MKIVVYRHKLQSGDWLGFRRLCETPCLYPVCPFADRTGWYWVAGIRGLQSGDWLSDFAVFAKLRACTRFALSRIVPGGIRAERH